MYTVKKIPDASATQHQIDTERSIAVQICHPLLPQLVEVTEEDGCTLFVYRYIEGVSLQRYLDIYGPVPQTMVIHWFVQLCRALHYLHTTFNRPVIHRDIKPDNLIIDDSNNIHLIDLNIARYAKRTALKDTIRLGSLGFAAPEQFGNSQSDERTDIYGLGVSMYFAITGYSLTEPPYQVLPPHLINRDISKRLSGIIVRCTQVNPSDRYAHAADLLKDISPLQKKPPRTKKQRRRIVQYICGAVAVVCIAAAVFMVISSKPQDNAAVQPSAAGGRAVSAGISSNTGTSDSKSSSFGRETTDTAAVDSQDDTPIVFTDKELERLLRIQLGKENTEAVTAGDMQSITSIYIAGKSIYNTEEEYSNADIVWYETSVYEGTIQSVEDLRLCTNLSVLFIAANRISDISPLASLTQLQRLYLHKNLIEDAAPLSALENLIELDLASNPITSLDAISGLRNIEVLSLDSMRLDNIDFMIDMDSLRAIFIAGNKIADLEPLRDKTLLTSANISGCDVHDLSPLADKPALKNLMLTDNGLTDISALSGLPNLKEINLQNNSIIDVTPLFDMPSLERINISNNPATAYYGIEALTHLEYINVSGNPYGRSLDMKMLNGSSVEVITNE